MDIQGRFKKSINNNYKKHLIKKDQNFYNSMLKDKSATGGAFFSQGTLVNLILLVTVFLQIISLATTFNGSKVYFGGIKLPFGISAPFLFALSIQAIVFYVSNTLRSNMRKWLMVILTIAVICSTYFSYIGIYNYINSPIDYLNERYSQVYGNLSEQYYTTRETQKNEMKENLFNLVNSINSKYISLVKTIDKNNVLQQKLNGIEVSSGNINAQTSSLARPNPGDYGDNTAGYYAAMAQYNQAVGNMISDSTSQDSSLKNELYKNEVKSILGGKTEDEFSKESIVAVTGKEDIEKSVEAIYTKLIIDGKETEVSKRLSAIESYCQKFISTSEGKAEDFTTTLSSVNALVNSFGEENKIENFQDKLNSFVVINAQDGKAMKNLKEVTTGVYKDIYGIEPSNSDINLKEEDAMLLYTTMATEVRNVAYTLNKSLPDSEKIDLNSETYVMDNLYVLPIKNLMSNKQGMEMSWFCLGFAMLIDGLTVIFALTNGKKNKTLFAKNNKDILGRSEEAMEDVIILSLMAGERPYVGKELVVKTCERLKGFINGFTLLNEGVIDGYSMWCPIKSLSKYQMLIATLCQFNLAQIVKEGELYTNKSKGETNIEDLLLIKTKFAIWANNKIATLESNSEYIDSINSLDVKFRNEEVIL